MSKSDKFKTTIWKFTAKPFYLFFPFETIFFLLQEIIYFFMTTTFHFGTTEHLLNPLWVTEALNMHQKGPKMVLNGKFSQAYRL